MIEEKTARGFIVCGWVAAIFSGVITVFVSILGAKGVGLFNLVDAAIFFGLAFGIYRGNRIATVVALVWWLVERLFTYQLTGSLSVAFNPIILILTGAYILAVIGNFSLQAGVPPSAASKKSPKSEPKVPKTKTVLTPVREFCGACGGSGKITGTEVPCAWCNGAGYV
jgi:hypothetical protein